MDSEVKDRNEESCQKETETKPVKKRGLFKRLSRRFSTLFRRKSHRKSVASDPVDVQKPSDLDDTPKAETEPTNDENIDGKSFTPPPAKVKLFQNDFQNELKNMLKQRSKDLTDPEKSPTESIGQLEQMRQFKSTLEKSKSICSANENEEDEEAARKTVEEKIALFESQISSGGGSFGNSLQRPDKDVMTGSNYGASRNTDGTLESPEKHLKQIVNKEISDLNKVEIKDETDLKEINTKEETKDQEDHDLNKTFQEEINSSKGLNIIENSVTYDQDSAESKEIISGNLDDIININSNNNEEVSGQFKEPISKEIQQEIETKEIIVDNNHLEDLQTQIQDMIEHSRLSQDINIEMLESSDLIHQNNQHTIQNGNCKDESNLNPIKIGTKDNLQEIID